MFRKSFSSSKCKTLLKLIVSRIKIVRNKHEIQLKHMQMDVFQLLQKGQDDPALTRVEVVIREQNIMDALNIIEIYSQHIIARMSLIDAQKVCPADLQEAVSSLLYAGPRCAELPELLKVRKLFVRKYGQDFVTAAIELHSNCGVSKKIIEKLSGRPPSGDIKEYFLKKIALENGLQWNPSTLKTEPLKGPEDMPGLPSAAKVADSTPSKSTKSDLAQVHPKMPNPFAAATPDPPVESQNKPALQPKADDPTSPRDLMISRSIYPDNPMLTSDDPDGDLYIRQFIPFIPINAGNSAAMLSEIGDSTVVASRKDSRNEREDMPSQKFVDRLNVDDEPRGSLSSYYRAVASAANAAAISAENAALAARAAAKLAHTGLSRESSMVSDTEENEIDSKNATTVPMQENQNLHKTRLISDINLDGGEGNLESGSLNPIKQWESISSKSSGTEQIKTEILDEKQVDLSTRHHSKAIYLETSSESEQELENIDSYELSKKVGNSSLIDRSPLKFGYHQQSSRGHAAASRETFEEFIEHDQAYSQHNEVMGQSSWHEPEEFPSFGERRDLFSTSKVDEHEKDPPDADWRLDSEIFKPIFDEDFTYKSRQHMEDFYGTEKLKKYASSQLDDEDSDFGIKETVKTTSKQKMALKPRVVPLSAAEIFKSGTVSEMDEVPSSKRSLSPPSPYHRTGGTQKNEYFEDYGNDEPRESKTLNVVAAFKTDETPALGRSFTPPSQSYKIAPTGKTVFVADDSGDEPSSPVSDKSGSKSSYENPPHTQNIRVGSKIQNVPQKSDNKTFTSKKNLFPGQIAKQDLDTAFEPKKIRSYSSSVYSDDSVVNEDPENQASAAQSVQPSDPPSNEEIGSMQIEKSMTKPLVDDADAKKTYRSNRGRIGESVRSKRTR